MAITNSNVYKVNSASSNGLYDESTLTNYESYHQWNTGNDAYYRLGVVTGAIGAAFYNNTGKTLKVTGVRAYTGNTTINVNGTNVSSEGKAKAFISTSVSGTTASSLTYGTDTNIGSRGYYTFNFSSTVDVPAGSYFVIGLCCTDSSTSTSIHIGATRSGENSNITSSNHNVWYIDSGGSTPGYVKQAIDTFGGSSYKPDITPICTEYVDKYTVKLIAGTGISAVSGAGTYNSGSTTTIDATVLTGYTWSKWSDNVTTKQRKITVDKDYTLTASATLNSYKATFYKNDGTDTVVDTYTKDYNTALGTLPTTSRTGYTFDGWYTAKSGGTKATTATKITSNVTYYARWTPNKYTITYSDGVPAQEYTIETNLTLKSVPSKTGYTVAGWKLATADGNWTVGNYSSGQNVGTGKYGDISLNAVYKINSYTAAFDANGGSTANPKTITKEYGSQLGTLPITSRSGYRFDGWYTEKSGGTKISTTTTLTSNVTYYAHWSPNKYTISLDANGGTLGSTQAVWLKYNTQWQNSSGSAITSIAQAPTRTGYTFNGFYTEETGGTKIINADKTFVQDKLTFTTDHTTLYAQWVIKDYYITYTLNGGTVTPENPETYRINSSTFTLNNPTRPGYIFMGWSGTGITGKSTSVTINKGSTGDRNYEAHWKQSEVYIKTEAGWKQSEVYIKTEAGWKKHEVRIKSSQDTWSEVVHKDI